MTFILDGREVDGARRRNHLAASRNRLDTKLPHLCYLAEARLPRRRQLPRLHGRDRRRARAGGELHPQALPGHEGEDADPSAPRPRARWSSSFWSPISRRSTCARSAIEFWTRPPSASRSPPAVSPSASNMPAPDRSHPAMAVNLDACIQCNLCVRACREVQVNDVIGMAGRGHLEKIVFDFDDPMGASTCVACGECVQACPTGALMPATLVNKDNVRTEFPDREVELGLPLLRRRLPAHLSDQERQAHQRRRPRRPGQSEPALRQRPLRLRLRHQSAAPESADDAQGRRPQGRRRPGRPGKPMDAFPRGDLGRSHGARSLRPQENPRPRRRPARSPASARPRARTKRPISSRS